MHTAELVRRVVDKVYTEWGIEESRKYRIQTDNGSNVVKCFRDFRELLYVRKEGVYYETNESKCCS